MPARILVLLLAARLGLGAGSEAWAAGDGAPGPAGARKAQARPRPQVDVRAQPMERIAPGTVIGDGPPRGWSHLVMQSRPRLGVGDVDSVPKFATRYSSIFLFTVLANVGQSKAAGTPPRYFLDKLAIGGAIDLDGKTVIATSEQTFGKDLGMIGRRVFQESEEAIASEIRQVVRTSQMSVFDGKIFMLYHNEHSLMVLRHVVLVDPADGRLSAFIWLLGSDGKKGYALAESALQMLPPALREDRVLSVDADKFTLGIPGNDAFALVKVPQGTPVRFSPKLAKLAAVRVFDAETALGLQTELLTRYAPLADRVSASRTARR